MDYIRAVSRPHFTSATRKFNLQMWTTQQQSQTRTYNNLKTRARLLRAVKCEHKGEKKERKEKREINTRYHITVLTRAQQTNKQHQTPPPHTKKKKKWGGGGGGGQSGKKQSRSSKEERPWFNCPAHCTAIHSKAASVDSNPRRSRVTDFCSSSDRPMCRQIRQSLPRFRVHSKH